MLVCSANFAGMLFGLQGLSVRSNWPHDISPVTAVGGSASGEASYHGFGYHVSASFYASANNTRVTSNVGIAGVHAARIDFHSRKTMHDHNSMSAVL
jgi:hypothetical protein